MRLQPKRLLALLLAGTLFGAVPTASAEEATVTYTEETDMDAETDDLEEVEEFEKELEELEKELEGSEETDEQEVSYKEQTLTITGSGFVADSLNGVDALYRKGTGDGSNSTYSCAAYIKRYYKEVHDVTVMNLYAGRTPSSSKGRFKSVKKPSVGDVVACSNKSGSNHWAIVKKVNDDKTVTLIEQNWKWSQGGKTVCKVNRSIPISSGTFYRLYE